MKWKKLGQIFNPATEPSINSHAQVPTVLLLDDIFRVYFAARDDNGKSYTVFVDLDRNDPCAIVKKHLKPIINKAQPGTFDDDGIMPGYVFTYDERIYMFYSGWNQKVSTPYHNATGLAVSDDGVEFSRVYEGPILDRTPNEPYLAVTPTLVDEGDYWRIWYISGIRWELIQGKYEPVYVIKSATSELDFTSWQRDGVVTIPQQHADEAFSHPSVIKVDGTYHMWFCFRDSHDYRDGHGSYRIGYAISADGSKWQRHDSEVGIECASSGWDSTMQCYPYVIQDKEKLYMFYNGNGFGQSGFGIAVMDVADLPTVVNNL